MPATFTEMNRKNAKLIGEKAERELMKAMAACGVTVKINGGSFDEQAGTLTAKFAFTVAGGKGKEASDFELFATQFDLLPSDLGMSFAATNGRMLKIIGLKPNAPKRPILCEGLDGKRFVFPEKTVADHLARQHGSVIDRAKKAAVKR